MIRQSQEGRDVTRQHVTAKDRLQAARAERAQPAAAPRGGRHRRRRPRRSGSRLDLVAGEINGLRAQLRDLRLRTDYAVVTVSLLVAGDHDDNGGVGGSFDDAVDDAGSLLVGLRRGADPRAGARVPLGLIALAALAGRPSGSAPAARVGAGLASRRRAVGARRRDDRPSGQLAAGGERLRRGQRRGDGRRAGRRRRRRRRRWCRAGAGHGHRAAHPLLAAAVRPQRPLRPELHHHLREARRERARRRGWRRAAP